MSQRYRGALLINGEAGIGKSRWIREEATTARAKLFRWNARIDRSLREGREVLHQQVRSKDRLFVWIEGADDLTQEAQAFLRRILETAAANVTCCLEVREIWKLSPPILSRCSIITIRSEKSYRKSRNITMAKHFGVLPTRDVEYSIPAWTDICKLRIQGADPYLILDTLIEHYGIETVELQDCIRAIGAGSSPWIQLSNFLIRV